MKLRQKRFQTERLNAIELIFTQGIRKGEKLNCLFLQMMNFHIEHQKNKDSNTKGICMLFASWEVRMVKNRDRAVFHQTNRL